jgi:hypothetical protein
VSSLKLKISAPTKPIPKGMGFYQLEDDVLYVPIGGNFKTGRFFSYIDSPGARFDLDNQGRLIFFEVSVPRRLWKKVDTFNESDIALTADIRWINFRNLMDEPEVFNNQNSTKIYLRLSNEPSVSSYFLADKVILKVSENGNAVGILVNEIEDDMAGHKFAWFKRNLEETAWPSSLSSLEIGVSPSVS